jgi:hypothetical protein
VTSRTPRERRLVREIVCVFSGELPTAWLAVFHRFEKRIERAGLQVRVRLAPLEDLPERFDILVVPPELRERARPLAAGATVLVATRLDAARVADDLVLEIERADAIYAEKADPNAPKIVTHRGMEEL